MASSSRNHSNGDDGRTMSHTYFLRQCSLNSPNHKGMGRRALHKRPTIYATPYRQLAHSIQLMSSSAISAAKLQIPPNSVYRHQAPATCFSKCGIFQRLILLKFPPWCVFVCSLSRLTEATANTEQGLRGRRTTAYPKVRTMGSGFVVFEMPAARRLHLTSDVSNFSKDQNHFRSNLFVLLLCGRACGYGTLTLHST